MSAALGTTRPTISKIRTGKKRLTDVVVVAIMETAQYSLDEVKVILDPSSKSMS
ncbi:hypothetical protein [Flavobacterium sp.]|uniref:hypothetical protein n=1 Tax=Flavobacterium sp. TaxID=239 RepID=UPI00345161C4